MFHSLVQQGFQEAAKDITFVLYRQFIAVSNSERICKIGLQLTKLLQKFDTTFLRHVVHSLTL